MFEQKMKLYLKTFMFAKRDTNSVIKHIAIKNIEEVLLFLKNKKVKISEKKI